jgi:DNA-binding MarR family transcriptional regulator
MSHFPKTTNLDRDDDGRLYDRNVRTYLVSFLGKEKAVRVEPFAAVRWLLKEMHQYTNPWAERYGLTEGRIQLLMRLKWGGDAALGELAEQLHVSARNVTGLVDHLERDGFVERKQDPNDRRSVRAHLTEEGLAKIDAVWRDMLEATLQVTEGIPQDDLDLFRDVCLRIVQQIKSRRSDAAFTPPRGKESQ